MPQLLQPVADRKTLYRWLRKAGVGGAQRAETERYIVGRRHMGRLLRTTALIPILVVATHVFTRDVLSDSGQTIDTLREALLEGLLPWFELAMLGLVAYSWFAIRKTLRVLDRRFAALSMPEHSAATIRQAARYGTWCEAVGARVARPSSTAGACCEPVPRVPGAAPARRAAGAFSASCACGVLLPGLQTEDQLT